MKSHQCMFCYSVSLDDKSFTLFTCRRQTELKYLCQNSLMERNNTYDTLIYAADVHVNKVCENVDCLNFREVVELWRAAKKILRVHLRKELTFRKVFEVLIY